MRSGQADKDSEGAIVADRYFAWGPEIVGAMLIWAGFFAAFWHGPNESPMLALIPVCSALVIFGLRFFQRKNRLRIVVYPERDYAEVYSNGQLSERLRFGDLSVVIQVGANTFGPAFAWSMGAVLFIGLASRLFIVPSLGAALLCMMLVASHLRTRLFHRKLDLPKREFLIPKDSAEQIAFESAFRIIANIAAERPSKSEYQRMLGRNLEKLGDQRRDRGSRTGALAAYENCLKVERRIAEIDPKYTELDETTKRLLEKINELRHH